MPSTIARVPSSSIAQMPTAMAVSGTIGWFVVTSGQPVLQIVFWRCMIGGAVLLPICLRVRVFEAQLSRRAIAIALFGGVAMVSNWLLLFASYTRTSISIATAAYHMQPFILVGLGALALGERLSAVKIGWLALAFGGLLLILRVDTIVGHSSTYGFGILLALGAASCWAAAALATRSLSGTPPHLIALIHVTVGAVMLAPLTDFAQLPQDVEVWSILLVIGLVHTGLVYILMYGAIQKLPTMIQGALSYLNPVAAFGIDALAFAQRLHASQILGMAAILIAAAGVNGLFSFRLQRLETSRQ